MCRFRPTVLIFLATAVLGSVPASAELYKWVDQRGITHYSDQPPADAASAQRLRPIENRVSVYSPDAALTQAVASARESSNRPAPRDTANRQGEYASREPAAGAIPEPCAFGCGGYGGYFPIDPGYGFVPGHRFPAQRLAQAQLIPGTIAGNVVGMNGYIPGYSAYAAPVRALDPTRGFGPPRNVVTPYRTHELPASRGPARR